MTPIEELKTKRTELAAELADLRRANALVDPDEADQAALDRLMLDISTARKEQHKMELAELKEQQAADVDDIDANVDADLAGLVRRLKELAPELVAAKVKLADIGWWDHPTLYSRIHAYPNRTHKAMHEFGLLARRFCEASGRGKRQNKFHQLPEFVALWRENGYAFTNADFA